LFQLSEFTSFLVPVNYMFSLLVSYRSKIKRTSFLFNALNSITSLNFNCFKYNSFPQNQFSSELAKFKKKYLKITLSDLNYSIESIRNSIYEGNEDGFFFYWTFNIFN